MPANGALHAVLIARAPTIAAASFVDVVPLFLIIHGMQICAIYRKVRPFKDLMFAWDDAFTHFCEVSNPAPCHTPSIAFPAKRRLGSTEG